MENEAFKTQVAKTSMGWEAQTQIALEGPRVLILRTCRSLRGMLATTATVYRVNEQGHLSRQICGQRGDYIAHVFDHDSLRVTRVTQKAVREQHALALEELPRIKADIAQFYAQKDALLAD